MSTHPSVRYALYARTRLEREVLDAIVALHCHPRDTWLCEDLASAVARAGAGKAEILIADVSVDDAMALDHCLQALSRGGQDARVILIISDTASVLTAS